MMFRISWKSWNLMRILRLAIGGYALVAAIASHDPLFGLAGAFLVGMAIWNVGCCGAGACAVNLPDKPVKRDLLEETKQPDNG